MSGSDAGQVPTIGVEEEFLLADRHSRAAVGAAPAVLKTGAELLGDQVGCELFPTMVETRTVPVRTLDELHGELLRLRAGVAAAAEQADCRAVASGTMVIPSATRLDVSDQERYRRMVTEYGPLIHGDQGAGVAGCHIHVGVPDRESAVQLANHLRPWLPTLQAIAANSPFHDGRDTGYAGWRTLRWAQFPGAGPTPLLADAAAYDALLDRLVGTGLLLDRRMAYWHARPSERFPTVEIRVCDVNADPGVVVLLAGLARALAAVLLTEAARGVRPPDTPDALLRAAHWRAARDGLTGAGVDLSTGTPIPAVELVERLLRKIAPGLAAAGDAATVHRLWTELCSHGGGGAERQRTAYRRRYDLRDVVDAVTLSQY
ncbi:glutamate--cysteine ligase [Kitasatospora sp. CMC57]|uniref:Putative glutamate--cysteine ligase 2 n=1 Tax=Kitasatospora sp. CMC57 TaxID=3231513 RepID=A0AB33K784_9ACTN